MNSPRFLQCHLAAARSLPSLLPTLPEFDPFWEAAFGIPPAHPTNTTSSRFFLQQLRTGNKLKKPSTFRSGTTQTTSFPASFPKNLIYECCTEFWPFTNQSKPEEQLGFSFISIPNPATLCALEIFPSFLWHMVMLMAPPGTDFPASNPPPLFSTPLGMWQS